MGTSKVNNFNWDFMPEFLYTDWDYIREDGQCGIWNCIKPCSGTDDDGFRPGVYIRIDLLPEDIQEYIVYEAI